MTKGSRIFGFALLLSALFSASADEVRNTYPTAEGLDVKVAPIVGSNWMQQIPPFTDLTPRNEDDEPCLVGCVATALSQIMRKDRMPSGPISPFENKCTVDDVERMFTVDGSPYDWENMLGDVVDVDLTETQATAIAKLVRDVGVAVGTDYSAEESTALLQDAVAAMTNHFGYRSAKFASIYDDEEFWSSYDEETGSFDYSKYLKIIRDNLDRGRPVLLGIDGFDAYDHAVVVDGYGTANGETYYHVIVGGGPRFNGWFRLPYVMLSDIDETLEGNNFDMIKELVYDIELPTPAAPDYMVIAPSAYVDLWTWYVGERAKLPGGKGHTFGVKNAAEIYAAYPPNKDATDGSPRNHAESIHKWIGEQAAKGTKYFVLGGNWFDAQNITGERGLLTPQGDLATQIPGVVTYPFSNLAGAGPMSINPSDLYFACHYRDDGAKYVWDPNGDAVYVGLHENEPDVFVNPKNFQPSVIVARMGFYDSAEKLSYETMVRNYVEKLKKGESESFGGRDSYAVWTSYCQDYDEAGYPDVYGVMTDRLNAILVTRPSAHDSHHYVRMDGEDPLWTSDIAELISTDWELFLPFGHGQPGAFAGLEGEYFANNAGLMKFFMGNVPCFTGAVNSLGNCATMGLGNPNGGFLASINNTSFGWASSTGIQQRYLGVSDEIVDWCLDAYVKDGETSGEAWRKALHTYSGIVLNPETMAAKVEERDHVGYEYCIYAAIVEEMLFGDPLVKIDYGDPVPKRRVPKVIFR